MKRNRNKTNAMIQGFSLRFICWTLKGKHLTNLKQPAGSHIFRLTQIDKSISLGCSESIIFLISARINVIITNTFIGAVERIMIFLRFQLHFPVADP